MLSFKTFWENFASHIRCLSLCDQLLYSHNKTSYDVICITVFGEATMLINPRGYSHTSICTIQVCAAGQGMVFRHSSVEQGI